MGHKDRHCWWFKTIAMVVVCLFSFNTIAYDMSFTPQASYEPNLDKLAIALRNNDILGLVPQDKGAIKLALLAGLKALNVEHKAVPAEIDLEALIPKVNKEIHELFNLPGLQHFIHEAAPVSDDHYAVMSRFKDSHTQEPRTYYAVFPRKVDDTGAVSIEIYTQDEYERLLQDHPPSTTKEKVPEEVPPEKAKADQTAHITSSRNDLIDFSSLTPERMKNIYSEAKENLSKKIDEILRIPPAKRTFPNTIRALEWALSEFDEAAHFIIVMAMVATDEKVSEVAYPLYNEASNYRIDIYMNEDLYDAVKSCAQALDLRAFDEEDRKLIDDILTGFRDNGMELDGQKRRQLNAVKKELTAAETEFTQNMNKAKEVLIVDEADLEGMPEKEIEKLASAGKGKRKLPIEYATAELVMPNVKSEKVRREFESRFNNLASMKNRPIFEKILRLRAKAAKLLGYANYANYVLKDRMAKDVDTVMSFLNELKEPLLDKNEELTAKLLAMKRKDDPSADRIYTWDVKYYLNQIKKEHFDPDSLREYFPAVEVVNTMLEVFSEFLELKFVELKDAPVWHEDVRAFEVRDKEDKSIGYFYLDLFPRDNKEKYKAMAAGIISGCLLPDGNYKKPVSIMISNCPRDFPHRDVEVFFHEFGHVMHSLLTKAKYARFSGTGVKHDFAETPSNTFQEFAWQAEVLRRLSGGRIPEETIEKMIERRKIDAIHHTLATVARATFDIRCHTEEVSDLDALIRECAAGCGIYLSKDQSYFDGAPITHIVGGYAAGYYGYLWSERYMRSIIARFLREGIGNRQVWDDLKRFILIWGGSRDEEKQLEDFLGEKPSNRDFLEFLGLKETDTGVSEENPSTNGTSPERTEKPRPKPGKILPTIIAFFSIPIVDAVWNTLMAADEIMKTGAAGSQTAADTFIIALPYLVFGLPVLIVAVVAAAVVAGEISRRRKNAKLTLELKSALPGSNWVSNVSLEAKEIVEGIMLPSPLYDSSVHQKIPAEGSARADIMAQLEVIAEVSGEKSRFALKHVFDVFSSPVVTKNNIVEVAVRLAGISESLGIKHISEFSDIPKIVSSPRVTEKNIVGVLDRLADILRKAYSGKVAAHERKENTTLTSSFSVLGYLQSIINAPPVTEANIEKVLESVGPNIAAFYESYLTNHHQRIEPGVLSSALVWIMSKPDVTADNVLKILNGVKLPLCRYILAQLALHGLGQIIIAGITRKTPFASLMIHPKITVKNIAALLDQLIRLRWAVGESIPLNERALETLLFVINRPDVTEHNVLEAVTAFIDFTDIATAGGADTDNAGEAMLAVSIKLSTLGDNENTIKALGALKESVARLAGKVKKNTRHAFAPVANILTEPKFKGLEPEELLAVFPFRAVRRDENFKYRRSLFLAIYRIMKLPRMTKDNLLEILARDVHSILMRSSTSPFVSKLLRILAFPDVTQEEVSEAFSILNSRGLMPGPEEFKLLIKLARRFSKNKARYIEYMDILTLAAEGMSFGFRPVDWKLMNKAAFSAAMLEYLAEGVSGKGSLDSIDFYDIAEKYMLPKKFLELQTTCGGKIHLNINPNSDRAKALRRFLAQLGIASRDHAWTDTRKPCLEIYLEPSASAFVPVSTIKNLLKLNTFAPFSVLEAEPVSNIDGSVATVSRKFISLQPSLRVNRLFWERKGDLKKGAKLLALLLITSSPYRYSYIKNIPPDIATCGPLFEGGGIQYDESGNRREVPFEDRADLGGVALITADDLVSLENSFFARVYIRYHSIGNALCELYRSTNSYPNFIRERSDIEKELAKVAEKFIEEAEKLVADMTLTEAVATIWRRGNWPLLRPHLENLETFKNNFRERAEKILEDTESEIKSVLLAHFMTLLSERAAMTSAERTAELIQVAVSLGLTEEDVDEIINTLPGADTVIPEFAEGEYPGSIKDVNIDSRFRGNDNEGEDEDNEPDGDGWGLEFPKLPGILFPVFAIPSALFLMGAKGSPGLGLATLAAVAAAFASVWLVTAAMAPERNEISTELPVLIEIRMQGTDEKRKQSLQETADAFFSEETINIIQEAAVNTAIHDVPEEDWNVLVDLKRIIVEEVALEEQLRPAHVFIDPEHGETIHLTVLEGRDAVQELTRNIRAFLRAKELAVDIEFDGRLHAEDKERIRKVVSWEEFQGVTWSGERSIIVELTHPITAEGVEYRYVKLKGVTYFGIVPPREELYEHFSVFKPDAEGRIEVSSEPSFQGAMLYRKARNEYEKLQEAYSDGLTRDLALGLGRYRDLIMQVREAGFVIVGVTEDKPNRLPDYIFEKTKEVRELLLTPEGRKQLYQEDKKEAVQTLLYEPMKRLGAKLREAHDKGYFLGYPHHDNFSVVEEKTFMHDFESAVRHENLSPPTGVAYRLFELHRVFIHMGNFPGDREYQLLCNTFGVDWFGAVLEGYTGMMLNDAFTRCLADGELRAIITMGGVMPVIQIPHPFIALLFKVHTGRSVEWLSPAMKIAKAREMFLQSRNKLWSHSSDETLKQHWNAYRELIKALREGARRAWLMRDAEETTRLIWELIKLDLAGTATESAAGTLSDTSVVLPEAEIEHLTQFTKPALSRKARRNTFRTFLAEYAKNLGVKIIEKSRFPFLLPRLEAEIEIAYAMFPPKERSRLTEIRLYRPPPVFSVFEWLIIPTAFLTGSWLVFIAGIFIDGCFRLFRPSVNGEVYQHLLIERLRQLLGIHFIPPGGTANLQKAIPDGRFLWGIPNMPGFEQFTKGIIHKMLFAVTLAEKLPEERETIAPTSVKVNLKKTILTCFILAGLGLLMGAEGSPGMGLATLAALFAGAWLATAAMAPGDTDAGLGAEGIEFAKSQIKEALIRAGVSQGVAEKVTEDEAKRVLNILLGDDSTSQKQKKVLAVLSKYSVGKNQALALIRLAMEDVSEAVPPGVDGKGGATDKERLEELVQELRAPRTQEDKKAALVKGRLLREGLADEIERLEERLGLKDPGDYFTVEFEGQVFEIHPYHAPLAPHRKGYSLPEGMEQLAALLTRHHAGAPDEVLFVHFLGGAGSGKSSTPRALAQSGIGPFRADEIESISLDQIFGEALFKGESVFVRVRRGISEAIAKGKRLFLLEGSVDPQRLISTGGSFQKVHVKVFMEKEERASWRDMKQRAIDAPEGWHGRANFMMMLKQSREMNLISRYIIIDPRRETADIIIDTTNWRQKEDMSQTKNGEAPSASEASAIPLGADGKGGVLLKGRTASSSTGNFDEAVKELLKIAPIIFHQVIEENIHPDNLKPLIENEFIKKGIVCIDEILTEFMLADVSNWGSILIPFRAGKQYYAMSFSVPGAKRPPWRFPGVLAEDELDGAKYTVISGDDFESFRRDHMRRAYDQAAEIGLTEAHIKTRIGSSEEFRTWLVNRIGSGKKILSIGVGEGDLEVELKEEGNRVIGLDISPKMAEVARKKGLEVYVGDAHALPENLVRNHGIREEDKFDVILFPETIGYLLPGVAYEEAKKVLKKGGKIIIVTYTPGTYAATIGYRRPSASILAKELSEAGFEVSDVVFGNVSDDGPPMILPIGEDDANVIYIEATDAIIDAAEGQDMQPNAADIKRNQTTENRTYELEAMWSDFWRRKEGEMPLRSDPYWSRFFESVRDENPNARILDICTGIFPLPLTACEVSPSFDIHAIDTADVPLNRIRDSANITFHRVSTEDLSIFPDEYFDVVTGALALEYTNIEASLREIYRVLKPGGRAHFLLHHPSSGITQVLKQQVEAIKKIQTTNIFNLARELVKNPSAKRRLAFDNAADRLGQQSIISMLEHAVLSATDSQPVSKEELQIIDEIEQVVASDRLRFEEQIRCSEALPRDLGELQALFSQYGLDVAWPEELRDQTKGPLNGVLIGLIVDMRKPPVKTPETIKVSREMVEGMLPKTTPPDLRTAIYRQVCDNPEGFTTEAEIEDFTRVAYDQVIKSQIGTGSSVGTTLDSATDGEAAGPGKILPAIIAFFSIPIANVGWNTLMAADGTMKMGAKGSLLPSAFLASASNLSLFFLGVSMILSLTYLWIVVSPERRLTITKLLIKILWPVLARRPFVYLFTYWRSFLRLKQSLGIKTLKRLFLSDPVRFSAIRRCMRTLGGERVKKLMMLMSPETFEEGLSMLRELVRDRASLKEVLLPVVGYFMYLRLRDDARFSVMGDSARSAALLDYLTALLDPGEKISYDDLWEIAEKYLTSESLFETKYTTGGKIHLDIWAYSEEGSSIARFANILGIRWQDHPWMDKEKPSMELHFKPTTSPYVISSTIDKLIKLDIVRAPRRGIRPVYISLQPTLRTNGLFLEHPILNFIANDLKQGAKLLALSLIASDSYARGYTKNVPDNTGTYGPMINGAGVLYDKKGKYIRSADTVDRTDLWNVAMITPEDIDAIKEGEEDADFSRIFRQYFLIGNALLALYGGYEWSGRYDDESKIAIDELDGIIDLGSDLADIAEDFIRRAEELFKDTEVYEAFTTRWTAGNWPALRGLLERLELAKDKLREPVMELLVETEGRITALLLADFMERLSENEALTPDERTRQLTLAAESLGLTEDDVDRIINALPGSDKNMSLREGSEAADEAISNEDDNGDDDDEPDGGWGLEFPKLPGILFPVFAIPSALFLMGAKGSPGLGIATFTAIAVLFAGIWLATAAMAPGDSNISENESNEKPEETETTETTENPQDRSEPVETLSEDTQVTGTEESKYQVPASARNELVASKKVPDLPADETAEPMSTEEREITKMVPIAKEAGLQIPTNFHDGRYTLLVDYGLFKSSGEYKNDIKGYRLSGGRHIGAGDRFNLERVNTSSVTNILAHVKDPAKTIVQISSELTEADLDKLKSEAPGIRVIRINTLDVKQMNNIMRRNSRFDLYAMMLAARRITKKDIQERNSIYKTLRFFLNTHYEDGKEDIAPSYIDALTDDNIAFIIKYNLSFMPAGLWEKPIYHNVAATLISA